MRFRAALLACTFALMPTGAMAQEAVVRVRVIRPDSQPIAGAQVRVDTLRARTDARGEARVVTSPGSRLLN